MAKWTWEVLMRTETTLQTESLPLRFSPCYKSGGRKSKLLREQQRSHLRPLAYNVPEIDLVANLKTKNYDNRKTVFRSTDDC